MSLETVPKKLRPNDTITLAIRPEHLYIAQSPAANNCETLCKARILDSQFFGSYRRCHLQSLHDPATKLLAHLPQTSAIHNDTIVTVRFNTELARILTE